MTTNFKGATKMLAATLAVLTAALTPTVFLGENKVFAASEKTKYVKNLRVFADTGADSGDAANWCKNQPENKDSDPNNDWGVFSDDLDDGATGDLKKGVGVYLCYQTTTNPKEAVRDLAVMNEQGNYSEGAYERILKDQRDMYIDMVNDTKTMIDEYRTNYKKGLPTAIQAHDFMNTYKEDDSGKLFGDFMLTVSDSDLAEVLLQANGQAVLMMQEQLAYACDTGNSTWLDRMEQLGSYANLRKQALKAYNNDANKADKALKQKYNDKAQMLADNWDDIYQHFVNMTSYAKKNGLTDMTEEQSTAYLAQLEKDAENGEMDASVYVFLQERTALLTLAAYKYGDGTLFDYFNRDSAAVSGDNLKELYPLVACLSNGQVCAVNETVSLYGLVMGAQNATAINKYKKGKALEFEKLDTETKAEAEEMKSEQAESMEEWKSIDPVSVYEGIDRGIYEGGVAVTSNAENYAKSKGANWADSFMESGAFTKTAIGLGVGSLACAVGAVICSKLATKYTNDIITEAAMAASVGFIETEANPILMNAMENYVAIGIGKGSSYVKDLAKANNWTAQETAKALKDMEFTREWLLKRGLENPQHMGASVQAKAALKMKIFNTLKIGLAVVSILLAAADITMTVIELYNYYNRDHLPIPKYMVDMSYNADKETSFIAYKGVLDQNGDQGDLNGGGGKQWLALYATYDEDAGDPILAPDGNLNKGITQHKTDKIPDGYSPLHFFGKPNAPQNLTYADGANGWSYNDDEDGTYFFFKRGTAADTAYAATALSFGTVMLIGGIGALIGAAIAVAVVIFMNKKKRKVSEPANDQK